jgi:hypothetical protein
MREKVTEQIRQLAEELLEPNHLNDPVQLKLRLRELYEKAVLLEYLQKETPVQVIQKTEEVHEIMTVSIETTKEEILITEVERSEISEITREEEEELLPIFIPKFDAVIEDFTLKKEFEDAFSLDEAEKLLEAKPVQQKQVSLHDRLSSNTIQVGLNDRIAFVNNLFNFSQSDFNKVLYFLNDCKTKEEAIQYVNYNLKPKYNWKGKEDLVERLMALIDRKFI